LNLFNDPTTISTLRELCKSKFTSTQLHLNSLYLCGSLDNSKQWIYELTQLLEV